MPQARNDAHQVGAWDRLTRWAPANTASSEVKLSVGGGDEAPAQPSRVELGADHDAPGGFGSDLEPSPSTSEAGGADEEEPPAGPSRKRKPTNGDGDALCPDGKKLKASPAELSPRKRKHREQVDEETLKSCKRLKGAIAAAHSDCTTSDSSGVESLMGEDMDANDVVVSSVVVPRRRAVFNWGRDHLKEPGYTRGSLSTFRRALRRIKREDAKKKAEDDPEEEEAEPSNGPANKRGGRREKKKVETPKREPTRRQPARKASAKISYAESD
ncbi:hypothetical protein BSKO_09748 [Bryopsis sp. KO-2023]|nr:hypothetical protein BSKO_09748 [Bryopsis sp. KO-2023]